MSDKSPANDWPAAQEIRQAFIARSAYREDDIIGRQYRVHQVLGRGGFGVVYLVRSIDDGEIYALKTYLDELIFEEIVKQQFHKEALIWVNLVSHPFIVKAHHVQQFDGRMFVAMDYIPADENGLVSVHDYIEHHGANIGDQMIGTWTIHFCHGMEHAQSRGIVAHRDIKPMNLLVGPGAFLKISDFGLVASLANSSKLSMPEMRDAAGLTLFRTDGKQTCGTLGYMAPEILRGEGACLRSDIYSYGLTLWQLASGTTGLPYHARYRGDPERFARELYEQQIRGKVIPVRSSFWPIIRRCLEPDPSRRFASYDELRIATKDVMKAAGTGVLLDFIINKDRKSSFADLVNRGASLKTLGLLDEAIRCYDQALSLDLTNPIVFVNKGNALSKLNRPVDAMAAYDAALKIDPKCEPAWLNRAIFLQGEKQHERAIRSLDVLLKLNPRHALALSKKGKSCLACGRVEDALACYKAAVEINPRNPQIWTDRGEAYSECESVSNALACYDRAIELKPDYQRAWIQKGRQLIIADNVSGGLECFAILASAFSNDAEILNEVGIALCSVNRQQEAIPLFEAALDMQPREAAVLWCNKGNAILEMDKPDEALRCYENALSADPKYTSALIQSANAMYQLGNLNATVDYYARALKIEPRNEECWFGRGSALLELHNHEPAIKCFDNALSIEPTNTKALYNKGTALLGLDRPEDAIVCFTKAVEREPEYANAWYVKAYVEKMLGKVDAAISSCHAFLKIATGSRGEQQRDVSVWLSELTRGR